MADRQTPQGGHHLYATPDTRALLGSIAPLLPGWADMDVLAISRKDVRPYVGENILKRQELGADIASPALTSQFNRFVNSIGAPFHPSPKHGGSDMVDNVAATIVLDAIRAPAATGLNGRNLLSTENNLCIISVPDKAEPIGPEIARWTGIPEGQSHFTVTADDLKFFTFAHESTHCDQGPLTDKIGYRDHLADEAGADQGGLNKLRSSMGPDNPRFHQVGQDLVDLRVLSAFAHGDLDHGTTPALNLEGQPVDYTLFEAETQRLHPEMTLHAQPGDDTRHGNVRGEALAAVFNKVIDYMSRELGVPPAEASQLMIDDPRLTHESVKLLNARGAFQDSPLETSYAQQYLEAADRHAAKYFDSDGGSNLSILRNPPDASAAPARSPTAAPSPAIPAVPAPRAPAP